MNTKNKSKTETRDYKYRVRLELFADIGKGISFNLGGSQITQMIFTKKKVKQNSGSQTDVAMEDFVADVEYRVHEADGPEDPEEKVGWFSAIRKMYKDRGYEAKVLFRTLQGKPVIGKVSSELSGAADLLMSPKAEIDVSDDPAPWRSGIDDGIVTQLRRLLDDDAEWAQNRRG